MKKKKEFLSVDKLYDFVKENKTSLEESGIIINKHRITNYSEYYTEDGEYFEISLLNRKFHLGYCFITEDSEDWGQAEGCQTNILHEITKENNEINIEAIKLKHLLSNHKSIKREQQIDEILKLKK